jgi:hypothetical protein
MVGIVIVLVQIAVALPLHIAAFFGTEPTIWTIFLECIVFIAPFLVLVPIAFVQIGRYRDMRVQVRALREKYGSPRWIWSISYWDEQTILSAPYAPVWMGRLALAAGLYALIVLIAVLILITLAYRADREFIHFSTLQVTVTILWMDAYFLPIFVSMWRERRIVPDQAAQAGIDHAA